MAIDVLWNARAAVTKYPLDQRIGLYAMVSARLIQCGLLYAVINTEAPKEKKEAQTSASFDGITSLLEAIAPITHAVLRSKRPGGRVSGLPRRISFLDFIPRILY